MPRTAIRWTSTQSPQAANQLQARLAHKAEVTGAHELDYKSQTERRWAHMYRNIERTTRNEPIRNPHRTSRKGLLHSKICFFAASSDSFRYSIQTQTALRRDTQNGLHLRTPCAKCSTSANANPRREPGVRLTEEGDRVWARSSHMHAAALALETRSGRMS